MLYGVLTGTSGQIKGSLQGCLTAIGSISGEVGGEAGGEVSNALQGEISGGSISGSVGRKTGKASNILHGGVSASIEPVENYPLPYTGSYVIDPLKREQILPTESKVMTQDLKVLGIYYYEVTNNNGGKTVTIGRD